MLMNKSARTNLGQNRQIGVIGRSSPVPGDPVSPSHFIAGNGINGNYGMIPNHQMQHHHIPSAQMMNMVNHAVNPMVNPMQGQMGNMAQFQGHPQIMYRESRDSEPNLNWGAVDMGGSQSNLINRNLYKKDSQSHLSGSTIIDNKVSLSQLAMQPLPPVIPDPYHGTNAGPENIV